jgi:hypothetical protein
MRGVSCLLTIFFCVSFVNAAYVPHSVEHDLYQVDLINELKTLVEDSTNEIDLILPKYASSPLSTIIGNFSTDLSTVLNKYFTSDFVQYVPIDGFYIESRSGLLDWFVESLQLFRLKFQDHTFGGYTFKIVKYYPFVIEVHTTQETTSMSENPNFIPVTVFGPANQDQLIHSTINSHLVFQFTKIDGKWLINYKNEDYSKLVRFCQQECEFLASYCTNSSCTQALANWNPVLNPFYPPAPGYAALRNPPVIYP